jgi:OmpA-OmpF porin, OOP family
MSRRAAYGMAFGACALVSRLAHADDARFAIDRYEPAERGSAWFVNESLDLRGNLRPSLGMVGSLAWRPFVLRGPDGEVVASPVRNLAVVHPGGSMVLARRLRIAFDMPLQVFVDGRSRTASGRDLEKSGEAAAAGWLGRQPQDLVAPPNEQGIGDLRVGADVRLFGEHDAYMTGAIGVQVWAPTGQQTQWASDGAWRARPRLMVGGRVGRFVYAAQLGILFRERSESLGGAPAIDHELGWAAAVGVRVAPQVTIGPELFGASLFADPLAKGSTPVEAMLGAHWLIADTVRVGAGVGRGLTGGIGAPVWRGLLGAEWSPSLGSFAERHRDGSVDRDGDGILDAEDACIDVAGVRSVLPEENGCPDRDGDGIADRFDACPIARGARTTDPKTSGCPVDLDFDDVPDDRDGCPGVPGIATNDPSTNGCPADTDGDGVDDLQDACPTSPGPRTDDPRTNGCDLDHDKDGIPDEVDACPNDAGPSDVDPARNGCPKAFVRGDRIKILEPVPFGPQSATIVEQQSPVLQAILDVLAKHPEIKKLRIEGHSDNRGAADADRKLSAARAAAIMKWLVDHGIDPSRLTSEGIGPDRPVDTNETEAGRANNRRVELHITPP